MDDAEATRVLSTLDQRDGAALATAKGVGVGHAGSGPRPGPFRFQLRVLKALVLRDLTTRYAQHRLGFVLGVILPVFGLAVLMIAFKLRGRMVPADFSVGVFVATGYPLWLAFIGMFTKVMASSSRVDALLMFPQITQLDLIISNIIVEFSLNTVVFLVLCAGVLVFTDSPAPRDPTGVLLCYWSCAWIGAALGLTMSAVHRMAPLVTNFITPFLRFGMWVSGVVFMVNRLPTWSWTYLRWNPILHAVEGARTLWGPYYNSPIFDPSMILGVGFVLTIIGLVMERASRRFVGS